MLRGVWLRRHLRRLSAVCLLVGLLVGCSTSITTYSLTVRNYCTGAAYTVDVYLDGGYLGEVTYSRTFYGIRYGWHTVRAEAYNGSYAQDDVLFNSDMIWTLCP